MKTLLSALQDGRLIELPGNIKADVLRFLGALLEAIPGIPSIEGITEKVLERENIQNTILGKGWACPHATSNYEGDLLCAIGWSPDGIEYTIGHDKVHLIVMYFVPNSQRNAYLKEISHLAKAIYQKQELQKLQEFTELSEVRNALLDAITHAIESIQPDTRARMIQLSAKQVAKGIEEKSDNSVHFLEKNYTILAISVLSIPNTKPIFLSQNTLLVNQIQGWPKIVENLEKVGYYYMNQSYLVLRCTTQYAFNHTMYDCLFINTEKTDN